MDNPLAILRMSVLVVLAGPLAAAVLIGLLGHRQAVARRMAGLFALAHLGLTLLVCLLAADQLSQRNEDRPTDTPRSVSFEPVAIPGSPEYVTSAGQVPTTAWSLLSFGPTTPGLPTSSIQFFVGFDGLNVWLVLLTSLMTLIAVWMSWGGITERAGAYYAWLFVLEAGVIGAFLSFDVILFYVFFELTLIPAFFLIGQWGVGSGRREAARKFFLYTLFGSLITLAGLIGVVLNNPTPLPAGDNGGKPARDANIEPYLPAKGPVAELTAGPITFSIPQLMKNVQTWSHYYPAKAKQTEIAAKDAERKLTDASAKLAAAPNDAAAHRAMEQAQAAADMANATKVAAEGERDYRSNLQVWLFFALMAGFVVKTPVFPFHTWLPAAYSEAPMAVTMFLSALLAKLGTFGMLRVVIPLVPDAAFMYGLPVFGFLGAVGIVYAALCAYAQRDAKLLVAYSSVSHLGLLVLGLFALNREGLTGAVLHMVNHGVSVGAMFGLLGFLYDRYRTLDMNQYGGLLGRYPGYAALFFVIALAGIGLPGLNNFVSEMMLLAGLFDPVSTQSTGYGLPAVAAFGVFLSSWYVMTMLRRIFFGPTEEPTTATGIEAKGMTGQEVQAFGLAAVVCIVLGLYPQPLIDTIRADAEVVANCVNTARVRAGYTEIPPPPAPPKPPAPPTTRPAPPQAAPQQPGQAGRGGGGRGRQQGAPPMATTPPTNRK